MSGHPIAVFDSGLGGLSVVRHLRQLLPHENLVYFGDTARIPYGTKSRPTVLQFALETAGFLLQFEPKLIVAACNTASALALDVLERDMPVPVIGVVKPGALAAVRLAQSRTVAVIGTEATIASSAYRKAIRALAPEQPVIALACPLFVPLVEEGRDGKDPIVQLAVETYLGALRSEAIGVLVLGCTHYPLLKPLLHRVAPAHVTIVDSAESTAQVVSEQLRRSLLPAQTEEERRHGPRFKFFATDSVEKFRRLGARFLGHPVEDVQHVDLKE